MTPSPCQPNDLRLAATDQKSGAARTMMGRGSEKPHTPKRTPRRNAGGRSLAIFADLKPRYPEKNAKFGVHGRGRGSG